MAGALMLDHLG